jgi:hypothetical protein
VSGYTPRLKWKAGDIVRPGETITLLEPPPPVVLDDAYEGAGQRRA